MKLLLITQLPPPHGGIASWSTDFLHSVSKLPNMEVQCVNCALIGKRAENFDASRSLFSEIIRTLRIVKNLLLLQRESFDAVHLNSACSPVGIFRDLLCALIAGQNGKFILHCHCTVEDQIGRNPLSLWAFRKIAKQADKIFVLNQKSGKWVLDKTGCDPTLLPNFIDSAFLLPRKKKRITGISEVFFAGHLREAKGIREMAAIARMNKDVHFCFAGCYTEEEYALLRRENISLPGELSHSEVLRQLDASDLFLFLSHTEGFSLSLLEAMARGVPVLASDAGANADMLAGCGAVIVPAKNKAEALAGFDALRKMSPEVLDRISQAEIRKVRELYTAEAVIPKILTAYE